jgi:hypothetical protein
VRPPTRAQPRPGPRCAGDGFGEDVVVFMHIQAGFGGPRALAEGGVT